jgi:hypothetical protein
MDEDLEIYSPSYGLNCIIIRQYVNEANLKTFYIPTTERETYRHLKPPERVMTTMTVRELRGLSDLLQ